ncbi:hypothetical protein BN179_3330002 [Clostridioides difficile T6]|nr:hypothetical protein BN178_870004 [Clostridioides difficile T42]CCL51401.1 hypothetical protein BN179_3330002 [Clostridioides difficile T6]DAG69521.1 MAG TPA: hypothetical protein [Caudoviricetes sp.]
MFGIKWYNRDKSYINYVVCKECIRHLLKFCVGHFILTMWYVKCVNCNNAELIS